MRIRWRQIGRPWRKRWRICLLNERRIAKMAISLRSDLMMYDLYLLTITRQVVCAATKCWFH